MRRINIIVFTLMLCLSVKAQDNLKRWHLEYPDSSENVGIADPGNCTAPVPTQKVIVAVIDGGTDADHEDLKDNIWTNPGEIAGNGIDDDKNGYADDVHGWNFLGGKNGNVEHENTELTRLYKMKEEDLPAPYNRKQIKKAFKKERKDAEKNHKKVSKLWKTFDKMNREIGKDTVTAADVEAYKMKGIRMKMLKKALIDALNNGFDFKSFVNALEEGNKQTESAVKYHYNADYDPRSIVGDDLSNDEERFYGNTDIKGQQPLHGTHVSGIIGAVRNSIGIEGVAVDVSIMTVRAVPDGDERDKDVANAIRYAVDNGAKVINMSFGKDYSANRTVVEKALIYAAEKDVLIVHGAGNESADNDAVDNFPNPIVSTGEKLQNWIEVGSTDPDGSASSYSNYGAKNVDVFAPGMQIYSTLPDNKYGFESGTSMSSPVVAGIACLIRSCYPKLTAVQVKEAIVRSAEKRNKMTMNPGSRDAIDFSLLSVSGGIVNAKRALEIAASM